MTVKLDWKVSRTTNSPEQQGEALDGTEIILYANDPNRRRLVDMLNNTEAEPIYLHSIFPKFLKVTNRGTVTPIPQLMSIIGQFTPFHMLFFSSFTLTIHVNES